MDEPLQGGYHKEGRKTQQNRVNVGWEKREVCCCLEAASFWRPSEKERHRDCRRIQGEKAGRKLGPRHVTADWTRSTHGQLPSPSQSQVSTLGCKAPTKLSFIITQRQLQTATFKTKDYWTPPS